MGEDRELLMATPVGVKVYLVQNEEVQALLQWCKAKSKDRTPFLDHKVEEITFPETIDEGKIVVVIEVKRSPQFMLSIQSKPQIVCIKKRCCNICMANNEFCDNQKDGEANTGDCFDYLYGFVR